MNVTKFWVTCDFVIFRTEESVYDYCLFTFELYSKFVFHHAHLNVNRKYLSTHENTTRILLDVRRGISSWGHT